MLCILVYPPLGLIIKFIELTHTILIYKTPPNVMHYSQLMSDYHNHTYYIHNKLTLHCSRDCNWLSALSKSNMLKKVKKWIPMKLRSQYVWPLPTSHFIFPLCMYFILRQTKRVLYVGHHGWSTKKILGFRRSKKAKITFETKAFGEKFISVFSNFLHFHI